MKRTLVAVPLALALGCSASRSEPDARPEGTSDASLARAEQLVRAGSYDEALLVTDAILARAPQDRAARLLAADANMALALAGRGNVQAFLLDAVHNLEAAAASAPQDAGIRMRLADAYLKTAYFDKGRDAALEAAKLLRAQNADAAAVSAAVLAAADNEMQMFVEVRQPEVAREQPPSKESVEQAQRVLARLAAARAGLPGKTAVRTAHVYQWLGQHEPAMAELERGIRADPTEPDVHLAYQSFLLGSGSRAECVAAYRRILAESGDHPTVVFYLGRAQFSNADGLRSRGQWDEASTAYEEAKASFERYRSLRPAHASTATHWQALCDLSRARIALDRGELDEAKRIYYEAYATDPRVLPRGEPGETTIADSFGGTYAGGLFMIGTALAEGSSPESLRRALEFFEEVIAKHPDAIGQFYNNAGLAARDLGTAVAQTDKAAAMELWERSYRHYDKAVELVPDDPRIVNDCGLMLVYHLERDLPRAKALFERAIELGDAQLAELPADATAEQRQFLEEAVGDAWQNLAVMARQQGKPFADYKDELEKAVRYYPYQRRTAAQLLRSQGERAQGLPGATAATPTPELRRQREALRDLADAAEKAAAAGDHDGALAAIDARADDLGSLPDFTALRERFVERKRNDGAFAAARASAQAALAAEDYDAALLALDEHARALDGHAGFHALVGSTSLQYAEQARANGGAASQIDGLYADAKAHLLRARELDGEASETRFWLTKALAATGDFEQAAQEAAGLLSHIRSRGSSDGVDLAAVHRARAQAAARVYIAAKQNDADAPDQLRGARESLRHLSETGGLDATSLETWMALEQWAGAPAQALEVATRAMAAEPALPAALDQGVSLAAQLGRSDVVVEALAGTTDATKQWYLGKALFQRAQELWATDKAAARQALTDSRAAFTAAKEANPGYADSSDQWIALGLGSKGIMLLGDDALPEAEAVLLEALRLRPDCATNDLGGGNSIKRALLVLGGKYQRDLEKMEALMRACTEALPGDVDFANNHGLAARDLGNRLERAGEAKAAHAMYEASYESYRRAAEAAPDNVRLQNDRALMLIYHLHRDLDDAVATLEKARDAGRERLRNDPPASQQERQDLEEAVGDCIENLGYYHDVHGKDPAKAAAAYEESLAYYPKEQRAAARRLQALRERGGK